MIKFLQLILLFIFSIVHCRSQTIISIEKEQGVYLIPCKVNGLNLKFIFDTGASDVTISLAEAVFMVKNGYLDVDDIYEDNKFEIANGDIVEGTKIILRKIQIGNLVLRDVEASIVHTNTAPLLLGQTALEKLGEIKIDYKNLKLYITPDVNDFIKSNINNTKIEVTSEDFEEKEIDNELEKLTDYISTDSLNNLIYKAENGDTTTQLLLGELYFNGEQIQEDLTKSFYWFKKATDLGSPRAMNNLGIFYDYGIGIAQDFLKAKYWYEKAANLGNAYAMYNLGVLYKNGDGIAQNFLKAKYWYEKAANLGNADAMNNLGVLYKNGEGVAQDFLKAKYWYEKATNLDNTDAMVGLGNLYHNGQGVTEDYAKAKYLYEKAANLENAYAMYNLGVLYENGEGVSKDYSKAKYWYEKAANLGNAVAMYNLGILYENGKGVAQDFLKAKYWYEKAANLDNTDAMVGLGTLYHNGQGVTEDYAKAKYWYEKAIEFNNADAMANLAALYEFGGYGLSKNLYEAEYWYEKAIENGLALASFRIIFVQNELYGVINRINLKRRKEMVKEHSLDDYYNNWMYLTSTDSEIYLFKDVTKDYKELKVWIKVIPNKNMLVNFRKEASKGFKSITTAQKIATQLSHYKELYILNCNENKLGDKSIVFYAKDGSVLYSQDSSYFNSYDMREVVPETIGEDILKTICEYYEKYGAK